MSRKTLSQFVTLAARIVLGLIFALSAAAKLNAPGIFESDVAAYHLLPAIAVAPFAFALPWLEAMLAVYLLVGLFVRPAAIVAAGLLLMFTAALSLNLASGNIAHGCGCLQDAGILQSIPLLTWLFGGLTITPFDVARDLVLTVLALVLYASNTTPLSLDRLLFGADRLEQAPTLVEDVESTTTATRTVTADKGRMR